MTDDGRQPSPRREQEILADRFQGLLVGTAVGDALGLPREGLAAPRARRLFGLPDRHVFLFGRGMISDDTEHSLFVAQRLAEVVQADAPGPPVAYCWPGVLPRNLLFLCVVLFHGFRRLLPPY